ncbi:GNAT family N-acetyltransferase [Kineococcus sp. SYSU DK006]|uniref:GNAT family N-acetyltransferase n=1 Tax=Kineococcus sp. SYSU DK006 TaxID=3383127 RepID=UPI003D7CCE39
MTVNRLPHSSASSPPGIDYRWRDPITDEEVVDLVLSHGGDASPGWWPRVREHSLGWVGARDRTGCPAGLLVGFVNVAWDGGDHAFLIDTKTRGSHQHQGIGRRLVQVATRHAAAAGCEWLFVDFAAELAPFYLDACGFSRTPAGLIHLRTASTSPTTSEDRA